jgi:hypothetical protein
MPRDTVAQDVALLCVAAGTIMTKRDVTSRNKFGFLRARELRHPVSGMSLPAAPGMAPCALPP